MEVHVVFETLQQPLRYVRNTRHLHTRRVQEHWLQLVDAEDHERLCRDCLALVGSRKKFCELL